VRVAAIILERDEATLDAARQVLATLEKLVKHVLNRCSDHPRPPPRFKLFMGDAKEALGIADVVAGENDGVQQIRVDRLAADVERDELALGVPIDGADAAVHQTHLSSPDTLVWVWIEALPAIRRG
jgi:hypothetical protein